MKKGISLLIMIIIPLASCSLLKKVIKAEEAVAEKVKIDATKNPAEQYLILNNLKNKRIKLENIVVKEVAASSNIDYEFCVIVDLEVEGKKIECYVYSKNVYKISQLKAGETRVNIIGDFKRFFSMLDEYYTKMEIIEAKITILEGEKK
jgi:hypothetical protein